VYQAIFYENENNKIHLWDSEEGYSSFKYRRYAYIENAAGTFRSLSGKKLKMTGRWSKEDEEDGIVHEYDISPEMRVLVDKYLDSDEISDNHQEIILDIEVSMEGGKPDIDRATNPITAISFYLSKSDSYTAIILDPNKKIKSHKKDNVNVISVGSEEDLLNKFLLLYIEAAPTVLTGWNTDYFDVPYLYHRLQRILGPEMAGCLSPIGIVKWVAYRERYRLAGVNCLDYLALYKKFTFSEEPTYNLDAIATKELGFGKIKYDGSLDSLFENDIEKFLEYNINDVKLVKLLNDKLKFIDLAKNICHKGHVPYEDVYYSSKFLEGAMLVYMKKLNLVAPPNNNRTNKVSEDRFEGAYVKEPIPGRYEWVFDADMQSLYPSIIMSLNISPETKVGKVIGWNHEEFSRNVDKTYTLQLGAKSSKLTTDELKEILSESKFAISTTGVLYTTDKKGIIPAILEQWFAERVEYKNLMKKYGDAGDTKMYEYFKARQYVQKVLLNSLYGVLGLPVFRFYDLDNATSVTGCGQEVIKYAQKISNYYYNTQMDTNEDYVIYTDTDSLFMSALPLIKYRHPDVNLENEAVMAMHVINVATELQKFVNDSFNIFAKRFLNISKHQFYIKQEMVAKSGIFLGKKRYALKAINDNGVAVNKLEVKGIDIVRADFPPAFRTLLKDLLNDILDGTEKDHIDKKILDFKKKIRTLGLQDIAKPTSVQDVTAYTLDTTKSKFADSSFNGFKNYKKGSPAHVKAAIMYNNLLKYYNLLDRFAKISDADKIRWVYVTQNEFGIDALAYRGYDDPDEIMNFLHSHINHEHMFDSIFLKKLVDLYSSLGWSLPSERQKHAENFFAF